MFSFVVGLVVIVWCALDWYDPPGSRRRQTRADDASPPTERPL